MTDTKEYPRYKVHSWVTSWITDPLGLGRGQRSNRKELTDE